MHLKDSLDLLVKVGTRVDSIWNFSVSLNTVTIGWIFLIARNQGGLASEMRLVVTLVYLVALSMSLFALLKEYGLFLALVDEAKGSEGEDGPLKQELASLSYRYRKQIAWCVHLFYAAIVILLVWTEWLFSYPK